MVVGYTDTPTWICPGDWDQILHLSKATQHQRHSNEVVFYCKLSSRGVGVCACETNCAGEREAKETEEKSRDEEVEKKGVCVCLSFFIRV